MNKLILSIILLVLVSCGVFKRTALKFWTEHQVKEFISNCEFNAAKIMAKERVVEFCDCAVDVVAENYKNYEDVKKSPIREIIKVASSCN